MTSTVFWDAVSSVASSLFVAAAPSFGFSESLELVSSGFFSESLVEVVEAGTGIRAPSCPFVAVQELAAKMITSSKMITRKANSVKLARLESINQASITPPRPLRLGCFLAPCTLELLRFTFGRFKSTEPWSDLLASGVLAD